MNASEFATGLRQIADWYEAHPDTALPYESASGHLSVYAEPDTRERAAELVRTLGSVKKDMDGSFLRLVRSFNGVTLGFVFTCAAVCEARVVGKRTIPAQPATPEREEDVIEWDCHAILSEPEATAP